MVCSNLLVLVTFIIGLVLVTSCSVDSDCSLNGICQNSVCECDVAWSGSDCGVLRLLPTPRNSGYQNRSASSWGGSIVKANGTFHMFVSEFVMSCGLNDWSPNSRVIRTVSTSGSPLGPYAFANQILPTFHHNPQVVVSPKGEYVLFAIGRDCNKTIDCSSGPQPPPSKAPCYLPSDPTIDNMESGISAFISNDIAGPFININKNGDPVLGNNNDRTAWDTDTTNPAPLIKNDGSVVLMYRGCPLNCGPERIGIAWSNNYNDVNYQRITSAPLCARADGTCNNEDPFIWIDKRGNYHALFHSLGPDGGFSCSNSTGSYRGCAVGTHAYSADGLNWVFSNTLAFNTSVCWLDNDSPNNPPVCEVLARRERPQILFEDGEPAYLTNGASYSAPPPLSFDERYRSWTNRFQDPINDRSFTLIVPINREN